MEPVGMFDTWDRVLDALHGGRNGNDFLDGTRKPLPVVVPVQDIPHVRNLIRAPACIPPLTILILVPGISPASGTWLDPGLHEPL